MVQLLFVACLENRGKLLFAVHTVLSYGCVRVSIKPVDFCRMRMASVVNNFQSLRVVGGKLPGFTYVRKDRQDGSSVYAQLCIDARFTGTPKCLAKKYEQCTGTLYTHLNLVSGAAVWMNNRTLIREVIHPQGVLYPAR